MSEKKQIQVDEDEYKALLAKSTSQATKIEQLTAQLKDSTDALVIIKEKMDAAEKEEKDAVINEIVRDSNGKLTAESLQDQDLDKLYFLQDALNKAEPKTFVSVMRQREQDSHKPPVYGTVGQYNPETQKYEGGIDA